MSSKEKVERANQLANSRNWPSALEAYSELAQDGDVFAQTQIAAMHYRGKGTARNLLEAEKWYRSAAESGDRYARFVLARFLIDERRELEAFDLLLQLSELPYLPACYWLSRLYSRGERVKKNAQLASYYLQYSGEHGHIWARRELALQKLLGKMGLNKVFSGCVDFVRVAIDGYSLAGSNPDDERLLS
jgi:uncharacterized protein